MKSITQDNLIFVALEKVPEWQPIYQKHLQIEFLDEVCPTLIFGDFGRATVETFKNLVEGNKEEHENLIKKIFLFIEEALLQGDDYSITVISTCFLENLPKDNLYYEQMKTFLPPYSLRVLETIDAAWNKKSTIFTPDKGDI